MYLPELDRQCSAAGIANGVVEEADMDADLARRAVPADVSHKDHWLWASGLELRATMLQTVFKHF